MLGPNVTFCRSLGTNLVLGIWLKADLKTLDISQGSVETHLRCGGIFSDSIITHFLLIMTVK